MSTISRAVRITQAGGPEVLSLGEIQVRDPGPGEVLVQVAAAGLNRADCLQRRGVYPAPPGTVPDVPGLEFSGTVAQLGSEVRGFKPGDQVMGICSGGAMAAHIVMHERELVRVPKGVGLIEAAAIPEVFMTAYDAMFLQAGLTMGERVLIHAVASGVGTAALQLALAVSAVPIGTSRSPEKLERVKALGLQHAIVPTEQGFAEQVKEATGGALADVILDTVGAKYLGENLKAAAAGGRIVVIGLLGGIKAELPLGVLVAKRLSLRGSVLRSRPLEQKAALAQAFSASVLPLFERGALRPVIADTMPMTEIREAHRRLEADEVLGKLVLAWP
jgi:NADPH2:quinone reductase